MLSTAHRAKHSLQPGPMYTPTGHRTGLEKYSKNPYLVQRASIQYVGKCVHKVVIETEI